MKKAYLYYEFLHDGFNILKKSIRNEQHSLTNHVHGVYKWVNHVDVVKYFGQILELCPNHSFII